MNCKNTLKLLEKIDNSNDQKVDIIALFMILYDNDFLYLM